jgi:hypothetical protein
MNKTHIIALIFGITISLLGLLWFLQGSDLVHIKPILCFANCQPITGKSLQWQIMGAIAFVAGAIIVYISVVVLPIKSGKRTNGYTRSNPICEGYKCLKNAESLGGVVKK